jgi:hypothetical protein
MNLVEVVILVGAQCLSPMESGPGLTEVGNVPCAVLIRQDPQTNEVEIIPPAAATDPDVIAMLVKPRGQVPVNKADRTAAVPAADDITGSVTRAPPPRIVPSSAEVDADVPSPKAKPVIKKKRVALTAKRRTSASRSDACGSYRAVWYTNKDGHRKYRCVKSG